MRSLLRTIRQFLSELRRRNVYQVGLAYLVAGFAVVELADIATGAFRLPGWFGPMVWVLCGLGFPIALVLAWAFEVVPEEERHRAPTGAAPEKSADEPESQTAETPRGGSAAETGPIPEKSVAVLPFTDMSPDQDHEYFGNGLAEEVLSALTQLEDLQVAARTSSFAYRAAEADVREIGKQLRVATVLEGSVRKAGDRLRVTAQLTDTETGYHLWSETYDRELEEVFAIQDEITTAIVEALQVELLGEEAGRLSRVGTDDPEAYDLYLRGRDYWHRRNEVGLENALNCFEQAIEKDPEFALAQAGVGEVCWALGIYGLVDPDTIRERAIRASRRAVELGPELPEAHCAQGLVYGDVHHDVGSALEAFERALALDPTYARAEVWRSFYLNASIHGSPAEGAAAARRAVELEPDSLYVRAAAGISHLIGGRPEEAARHLDYVLQENPEMILGLCFRALVYSEQGDHEAALELLERATGLTDRASFALALLGAIRARAGHNEAALNILGELEERAAQQSTYVSPTFFAIIEAELGRDAEALDHLEHHLEARYPGLEPFIAFGTLDRLRGHPRFDALLEELELV